MTHLSIRFWICAIPDRVLTFNLLNVLKRKDYVAIGTCTIRIKVLGQMSNPSTIRIRL